MSAATEASAPPQSGRKLAVLQGVAQGSLLHRQTEGSPTSGEPLEPTLDFRYDDDDHDVKMLRSDSVPLAGGGVTPQRAVAEQTVIVKERPGTRAPKRRRSIRRKSSTDHKVENLVRSVVDTAAPGGSSSPERGVDSPQEFLGGNPSHAHELAHPLLPQDVLNELGADPTVGKSCAGAGAGAGAGCAQRGRMAGALETKVRKRSSNYSLPPVKLRSEFVRGMARAQSPEHTRRALAYFPKIERSFLLLSRNKRYDYGYASNPSVVGGLVGMMFNRESVMHGILQGKDYLYEGENLTDAQWATVTRTNGKSGQEVCKRFLDEYYSSIMKGAEKAEQGSIAVMRETVARGSSTEALARANCASTEVKMKYFVKWLFWYNAMGSLLARRGDCPLKESIRFSDGDGCTAENILPLSRSVVAKCITPATGILGRDLQEKLCLIGETEDEQKLIYDTFFKVVHEHGNLLRKKADTDIRASFLYRRFLLVVQHLSSYKAVYAGSPKDRIPEQGVIGLNRHSEENGSCT